jgi:hypothetical protein
MGTQGKRDPGDGETVQWAIQETENWEMGEVGVRKIGQLRELGNEETENKHVQIYEDIV